MSPMIADTVFSDEGSLDSVPTNQSQSSRGSSNAEDDYYGQYIGPVAMCGAAFTTSLKREQTFICFAPLKCRRLNHKQAPRPGVPGCYYRVQKSTKGFRDGILDTEITEDQYLDLLAAERAEDEEALGAYASGELPLVPPTPSGARNPPGPSSWTRTLGLTGVTGMLYGGPTEGAPDPPSARRTMRVRPANVQFSSPIVGPSPITTTKGRRKAPPGPTEEADKKTTDLLRQVERLTAQLDRRRDEEALPIPEPPSPEEQKIQELARLVAQLESQLAGSTPHRVSSREPYSSQAARASLGPSRSTAKLATQTRSTPRGSKGLAAPPRSPSDSEDSLAPPPPPPTKYWYGIAFGKYQRHGVFEDKAEARALIVAETKYTRTRTLAEAWDFVHYHTSLGADGSHPPFETPSPTPPNPVGTTSIPQAAPTQVTPPISREPPGPPMLLNNKDRSTKVEEEIYGISLDVDTQDLRRQLVPPGTSDERAIQVAECLVDAVSLPGKTTQSGEGDDTAANIHSALAELVASNHHLGSQSEDVRKDLKWKNHNRQALKGVKTEAQLSESLRDVMDIRDRTLRNLNSRQKTILSKEPWNALLIDAWSNSGYVSVISRRSVDHYISLLQHLVLVASNKGWDEAQNEIDFYTKEWALIRGQCITRLMALCRIYVSLRDGADAKWLSPTLEAERVTTLFKAVAELRGSGTSPRTGNTAGGGGGGFCEKCGTILHGRLNCPWGQMNSTAAKRKGSNALKKLGMGEAGEAAVPEG
jgi:hypothetical protein